MNRIILLSIFGLSTILAFSQSPTNDPHWQLKWEDNFNTFDNVKWIKMEYGRHGDEPQLYLADQVWTGGGNLVIELNNNKVQCPSTPPWPPSGACGKCTSDKWYNYQSGWIETKTNYNVQFGYIEARIKLPFRRVGNKSWGFFPAFWSWQGDLKPVSNQAEIDIFEVFGGEYKEPNTINTCIHRWYNNNNGDQGRSHTFSNFDYTDWHTYAIEWDKDRIVWYLDNKAIRTTVNHLIVDPVRIILNLAIQSQSYYLPPTSPTFKEYMYVDYVKVYSLKCDKNTVVTQIPNFNTYNYAVKKSISLSNTTTIPANSNITLRATDFIELKAGFEVPLGRELYLDVSPCSDDGLIFKPNDLQKN